MIHLARRKPSHGLIESDAADFHKKDGVSARVESVCSLLHQRAESMLGRRRIGRRGTDGLPGCLIQGPRLIFHSLDLLHLLQVRLHTLPEVPIELQIIPLGGECFRRGNHLRQEQVPLSVGPIIQAVQERVDAVHDLLVERLHVGVGQLALLVVAFEDRVPDAVDRHGLRDHLRVNFHAQRSSFPHTSPFAGCRTDI